MTGTNSSNDRLVLRQNVEIDSNEYFSATYFFGNEIVDHVAWKRHCAITKKNVFEFRVIPTIHDLPLGNLRRKGLPLTSSQDAATKQESSILTQLWNTDR